ncbi:hypothetical protein EVAR_69526_1 [Eumeta japonica]|uniref:DUF4817 domain-containing protein n=1 Tax=Eumeta variegata TaxID=151549 RepID=A0A4C1THH7_EUMVA|nr:hypothetical protein EVAR_69526_1 [Eumeta japonica]
MKENATARLFFTNFIQNQRQTIVRGFCTLDSYKCLSFSESVTPGVARGQGSGGGRQSRVGSFELFLFVPRSSCKRIARKYGEMIMCYGEARGNAREVLRIYVERYPDRRHPSDSRRLPSAYRRVLENGPIVPNQEGAGRPVRVKPRKVF